MTERTHTASVCVRFAPDGVPNPAALVSSAVTGVLVQCREKHCDPMGPLSAAVGPSEDLVGLFDRLKGESHAGDARTVANEDQIRAAFAAEPGRFCAIAFCQVAPREDP